MYSALKVIHVIAVILFMGNIITGVFWKMHADGSHDPRIIAHTLAGVMRSDRWFTIPGVLLIVAAGIGTAMLGHLPILHTPWIVEALSLFVVSGVLFGARVAPLQKQLYSLANAAAEGQAMDWDRYRALSAQWGLWGTLATLAPAAAVVLMVVKPN